MKIRGTFRHIRSAFELFYLHSEYIPNILVNSKGQLECFAHVQNCRGAFEVEKYRTAFEVYSNFILTTF